MKFHNRTLFEKVAISEGSKNTLEPFYLKANLGTRFEVGLANRAFSANLFRASFKMTLKINQERRKRRLFKGLKIVGHRIVQNSTVKGVATGAKLRKKNQSR